MSVIHEIPYNRESRFDDVLPETLFKFGAHLYRRTTTPNVAYRIAEDTISLMSGALRYFPDDTIVLCQPWAEGTPVTEQDFE